MSIKTEKLYDLPEAASLLGGISTWTLRRWIAVGNVSAVRLGRRIFLRSEEVERIRQEGLPSLRNTAGDRSGSASGIDAAAQGTNHDRPTDSQ